MTSPSDSKVTIYYNAEENWMHVLIFNTINQDGDPDIASCRSEIMPYSDAQLAYFSARAQSDQNIYLFKAERLTNNINSNI